MIDEARIKAIEDRLHKLEQPAMPSVPPVTNAGNVFSTAPHGTLPESTGSVPPFVHWVCKACSQRFYSKRKPLQHSKLVDYGVWARCDGPVTRVESQRMEAT